MLSNAEGIIDNNERDRREVVDVLSDYLTGRISVEEANQQFYEGWPETFPGIKQTVTS